MFKLLVNQQSRNKNVPTLSGTHHHLSNYKEILLKIKLYRKVTSRYLEEIALYNSDELWNYLLMSNKILNDKQPEDFEISIAYEDFDISIIHVKKTRKKVLIPRLEQVYHNPRKTPRTYYLETSEFL